jgi:hypothetical protein
MTELELLVRVKATELQWLGRPLRLTHDREIDPRVQAQLAAEMGGIESWRVQHDPRRFGFVHVDLTGLVELTFEAPEFEDIP